MTCNIKEKVTEILKSGNFELERDGWTQYEPEYFYKAGFPKEFIDPLITTFKSDGSWKGSLWKDEGKALAVLSRIRELPEDTPAELIPEDIVQEWNKVFIAEATGVYYLEFLYALAELYGVEKAGAAFSGRGFRAGAYKDAIETAVGLEIPA
tara:strand:- start:1286 stop:1741 length:456 start_codon:yes stop_codon:yes gene_type:complete